MLQVYKNNFQVLASNCNCAGCMGVADIFNEFQDIATVHSQLMKIDGNTLRKESGAFWVVLKNKIHIYTTPKFLDRLVMETWPNMPGPVRSERNYVIRSVDGSVMVEGRSEWVILDCNDRTLRKLSSTGYPLDDIHDNRVLLPTPYTRMKETVTKDDFVFSKKVMSSDIDLSNHTNNVVYCRLMLDAFNCDFFINNVVTDFEISYQHESREGEYIEIYKKDIDEGYFLQASSPDGRVYATAILKVRKK